MSRFKNASRCVWIVDFNHVIHRYFNAMKDVNLTATVKVERVNEFGGTYYENVLVDTGVFSQVIKFLVNLSSYGSNPMIICRDSVNKSRKSFFKEAIADGRIYSSKGSYKAQRVSMKPLWKKSSDLCIQTLVQSGACVIGKDNYEADDLILEAVLEAKKQFPDLPINILANDLDLAPLIDEQVSLYKYPAKLTFAFDGYQTVLSYQQITPRNYQSVLEATSIVKRLGTGAVYNSLLLSKIVRGDSSDNIDCMPLFYRKPQRLRDMIDNMSKYEPDFEDIFRYYPWKRQYLNKVTGDVSDVRPSDVPASDLSLLVVEPEKEILRMSEVLHKYGMSYDEIEEFKVRYEGMNLNGAFINMKDESLRRRPFKLPKNYEIKSLDVALISMLVSKYGINIKL